MKRPEGFDAPPGPPSGTPKSAGTPASQSSSLGLSPSAASTDQQAPKIPNSRKSSKPSKVRQSPKGSQSPDQAKPPDDRAAQRALAKASSARRRFERGEARRFTRRSRKRKITWLVSLITMVVLVGAVTGAVYSPLLSLTTVKVEGAVTVSAASIREAVAPQLGTPLALIDGKQISDQLAQFPLIRSFVTETLPPHTLVIRISERVPVASISTLTGFAVVDPAGVVIAESTERAAGFPLIELGTVQKNSPGFTAAVVVLLALPSTLAGMVDTISAQTSDDVTLKLTGGKTVVWGSSEQTGLKARVLAAMVAAPASGAATKYDVSAPMHPVFATN